MGTADLPDFDALWDFEEPVETEAAFRGVLATTSLTAPDSYVAELHTQIARCLGLQRKFDEAHRLLGEVHVLPAAAHGRCRVRYLLERGRVLNSSGQKAKALSLFIEAWELGREIDEDGLAVDAAHMAAIADEPVAALQWNLTALELASSSPMESARKWRKSLHNNIGWTFFDLGKLDEAMYHFEMSRQRAAESGDWESEGIARWCIAKTHRVQGRIEQALAMQQQRLAEIERDGGSGGYVFEEIGEGLYALDRKEEAAPYFAKAYAELSQDPWLADGEPERIARLKELGKL